VPDSFLATKIFRLIEKMGLLSFFKLENGALMCCGSKTKFD